MGGKKRDSEPSRQLPAMAPLGTFESYTVIDGLVFFEYDSLEAMQADRRPLQQPQLQQQEQQQPRQSDGGVTDVATQTDGDPHWSTTPRRRVEDRTGCTSAPTVLDHRDFRRLTDENSFRSLSSRLAASSLDEKKPKKRPRRFLTKSMGAIPRAPDDDAEDLDWF